MNDILDSRPERVGHIDAGIHERCDRCHRRLKGPESMRIGMGPVCRKRAEAELERTQEA